MDYTGSGREWNFRPQANCPASGGVSVGGKLRTDVEIVPTQDGPAKYSYSFS